MTWIAVAIGGSALIGGAASLAGANKQAKASEKAADISQNQFAITNAQQQPFMKSGYGAMSKINTLLGLGGTPTQAANAPQMQAQDPGINRPIGRMTASGYAPMMEDGPNAQPPLQNFNLRHMLNLRAQHGDTEAAKMLGMI